MKHEVVEDDEVVDDEVVVKKKFTMILDVVDGKEQAHFAVSYLLCLDPPPPMEPLLHVNCDYTHKKINFFYFSRCILILLGGV